MVPIRPVLVRYAVAIVCLSTLVLICGCGKSTGTVSGKVSLDGKPLKGGGTLTFESGSGSGGVSGIITAKGAYAVYNAPVGEVKITLTPNVGMRARADTATTVSSEPPHKKQEVMKTASKASKQVMLPESDIPMKYTSRETSGLTYTVKPGDQTFDISLSSR